MAKHECSRASSRRYIYKQQTVISSYKPLIGLAVGVLLITSSFFGIKLIARSSYGINNTFSGLTASVARSVELSDITSEALPKVAASANNAEIEAKLTTYLDGVPIKRSSVAIYDLSSDQWIARINSEDQFVSASLYKLYVAYGLSKEVPYEKWDTKRTSGRTYKECVDLMLRVSNNPCGMALGATVGWADIDAAAEKAGFEKSSLARPDKLTTTSDDTTRYMRDLYYGKLYDKQATEFIMSSLKRQSIRKSIPAGCKDCVTYNKTGEIAGYSHDSAIVESNGRTYAVTILTEGGNSVVVANIERTIEETLKQY